MNAVRRIPSVALLIARLAKFAIQGFMARRLEGKDESRENRTALLPLQFPPHLPLLVPIKRLGDGADEHCGDWAHSRCHEAEGTITQSLGAAFDVGRYE